MASAATLDAIKVIDVDTHITEPIDLWTSRISMKRWGDDVLHVNEEPDGSLAWYISDKRVGKAPAGATAAWIKNPGYFPNHPKTYEEIHSGAYEPRSRLKWMDDCGIYAQVIYPNVAGFAAGFLLRIKEPELRFETVRVYNDFLTDWCAADPKRLIPLALVPYWDVDEAIKELHRVAKTGHRGFLMSNMPETLRQPMLSDPRWDPLWAAAQDLEMSVNFHIGSGERDREKEFKIYQDGPGQDSMGGGVLAHPRNGLHANFARQGVLFFLDNAKAVTEVLISGICHRYPRLQFVSVESGASWIPFVCEALDWQWINMGARDEHPEYNLLPSEYFKRQVHACFWFERAILGAALNYAPDSFMFETDFPHPTSLTPGPLSIAVKASDHIRAAFADIPDDLARKALFENAANVYRLEK